MNNLDPQGNWRLIGDVITGGVLNQDYGPLVLVSGGLPFTISPEVLPIPKDFAISLDTGFHVIQVVDGRTGCEQVFGLDVLCNPLSQADTILIIPEGMTDTICLDVPNPASFPAFQLLCPQDNDGNATALFTAGPECVVFRGDFIGEDQFCLRLCDVNGDNCDTLIVGVRVVPITDTVNLVLPAGLGDTICLQAPALRGGPDTIFNACPSLNPVGSFTLDASTDCVYIDANTVGRDSACVVLCNAEGFCDTTVIFLNVVELENDTIRETIEIDQSQVFCLDTTWLTQAPDSVVNICPELGGTFVEFTLETDSLCVRTTGLDFWTRYSLLRRMFRRYM